MAKTVAKVFFSDLHIGDGGKADDFTSAKERTFVKLLDELAGAFARDSELVLLGDIFDLIEQETRDPLEAMETSIRKHGDAVQALQKWVRAGNRLFYVTGNHDHALRMAAVSLLLVKEIIGGRGSAAKVPWGRFVIDDWYASPTFGIYAEHGNRFDADNNHGGTEECFGDKIVREVLRPMETGKLTRPYRTKKKFPSSSGMTDANPLAVADSVRPRGNIVHLIDRLTAERYYRKQFKRDLQNLILDLYQQHPEVGSATSLLISKWLRWALCDQVFVDRLNERFIPYRDYARTMTRDEGLRLRDLSFQPTHVVMGHTHFFDKLQLDSGATYLNLGSWLDSVFVDDEGNIGDVRRRCPFLVFTPGAKQVPYALYDSTLDKEVSWDEVLADRDKYGVA
jgi:hypothetical protein